MLSTNLKHLFTKLIAAEVLDAIKNKKTTERHTIKCACCGQQTTKQVSDMRRTKPSGERRPIWCSSCIPKLLSKPDFIKVLEFMAKGLKCKHCDIPLTKPGQFCSSSCSCVFNNKRRDPSIYEKGNPKRSETLKKKFNDHVEFFIGPPNPSPDRIKHNNSSRLSKQTERQRKRLEENTKFEFCKVSFQECSVCHINFLVDGYGKRKYCKKCKENTRNYMTDYYFKFNVFHFPDLFDLDLLKQKGFYGCNGHSGRNNPDGLSRDHRVSVREAIENKYEKYFIKHPINCQLIPQKENLKKYTRSSISYQQLIEEVEAYDLKNPDYKNKWYDKQGSNL